MSGPPERPVSRGSRPRSRSARHPVAQAPAAEPLESPEAPADAPVPGEEPVWLVRALLILFLLGFAAFLGQEVARVLGKYP